MLPFLKKQEGSVSVPAETIKRKEDEPKNNGVEMARKALNEAKTLIESALALLEEGNE